MTEIYDFLQTEVQLLNYDGTALPHLSESSVTSPTSQHFSGKYFNKLACEAITTLEYMLDNLAMLVYSVNWLISSGLDQSVRIVVK